MEALNSSFYHHGYPVGINEVEKIGLPVKNASKIKNKDENGNTLENLIWMVWKDIESEMQCSKSFDPMEIVLNDKDTSDYLNNIPVIANLPVNIPDDIKQPIMKQILNQILKQVQIKTIKPIEYETFNATLESCRCMSMFKTQGKITAIRLPSSEITINTIKISDGWVFNKV